MKKTKFKILEGACIYEGRTYFVAYSMRSVSDFDIGVKYYPTRRILTSGTFFEDYDFDKFYPKIMSSERFGKLEESVKIDKAGFFGDKTYRPGHKIVTEEEMNKMINQFGWFTSSKYVLGK